MLHLAPETERAARIWQGRRLGLACLPRSHDGVNQGEAKPSPLPYSASPGGFRDAPIIAQRR
ncbi:hypothetical protein [Reticulibacter mediterranei]|uniref:hypothetical protein n=1 Tax=Reticulibacter mediterranei TaxID=2778369 RepID=UPI001C693B9C|nr:hypothetical protein [Reticulibacter mediterranei]